MKKVLLIVGGVILFFSVIIKGFSTINTSPEQVKSNIAPAASETSSPKPSYPPESIVNPEKLKNNDAPSYNSPSYSGRDKDCSDFSTHAEAQEFFENAGPGDPHRLDRDSDGLACEALP